MKNRAAPLFYGMVILFAANTMGGGSPVADRRGAWDSNDSPSVHSEGKKWDIPVNDDKYSEFRRKAGLFVCKRLNVSPELAHLDPRFASLGHDDGMLLCSYRAIECDKRLDTYGEAIGTYFFEVKSILNAVSKVGEYQIAVMVDTDGYVSRVEIIKDSFNIDELKSLMIDLFGGLYFMPIGGTKSARLVISVTASPATEKR